LDCGGLAAALTPAAGRRKHSQHLSSAKQAIRSFGVGGPHTYTFVLLFVRKPFPTSVHIFAQARHPNSIDAATRKEYLPPQIEPKSLNTLRLSFESTAT
jgi:hypothetical protein